MRRRRISIKHRLLCLAAVACSFGVAFSVGVPAGEAATQRPQLLARHQPVTQFDPLERFLPTKVQSFVFDADLEQLVAGNWTVVDTDPRPGEPPTSGTWRLNQDSCSPPAFLRASGVSSSTSNGPGPIGTVPVGTSPQGPDFHSVWTDPLGTLATWPAG